MKFVFVRKERQKNSLMLGMHFIRKLMGPIPLTVIPILGINQNVKADKNTVVAMEEMSLDRTGE